MRVPSFRWAPALALVLFACADCLALDRGQEPVLMAGSHFPELYGRSANELGVFRWDASAGAFVAIPFQMDQRLPRVFGAGTDLEFTEVMYDVFREDDGRLDPDDEVVFLFGDAGPQAPVEAEWPAGAQEKRYEIRVLDDRPGVTPVTRYAYLFQGGGLARSLVSYVNWDGSSISTISSEQLALRFQDRWLLTELRVHAPCGTGVDLIDRLKGRAGTGRPEQSESEQTWNQISFYMGGIVGPVRAIRYVRGAASGFNTIHHDIVYRAFWQRTVNLRVHNVANVWLYLDWLPIPGARLYTPLVRNGVPMDGSPDRSIGTTLVPWTVTSSPAGGAAMYYEVPPSPFVTDRRFYYADDDGYNDAPPLPGGYFDEDDIAIGNHGVQLVGLLGEETDTITASYTLYPLCSGDGDATTGDLIEAFRTYPLDRRADVQFAPVDAVRTLQVARSGLDVALSWAAVAGSTGYRVYTAAEPDLPAAGWTALADTTGTIWVDEGALLQPDRYYSVVPLTASGDEGPR
jgi:hypothetical protein